MSTPLLLSVQWRAPAGFAHGLPQPPAIGQMWLLPAALERATTVERFLSRVAGMSPSGAAIDSPRAFVERLLFWACELQRRARIAVASGHHLQPLAKADDEGRSGFIVALPARSAKVAIATLRDLASWANTLLVGDGESDVHPALAATAEQTLARLRRRAEPGFNQFHLLQAAQRLGVPVNPVQGRKWRLGTGIHMRLVESTRSDATPAMGLELAQSKHLTARLLAERGLPVPVHRLVDDAAAAEAAALALGYPVVVKPDDRDRGLGVATSLSTAADVQAAYADARAASPRVLVERHIDGCGHRLTVADGQLVAVLKRSPGGVTGDGVLDIRALLELQSQRPEVRRSLNMGRVMLDEEALALLTAQQLAPESVPEAGRFVRLRRRDNLSAGGTLEHLPLTAVHPDNQRLAVRATEALFLDVAGVDLISTDIGRSWRETGAVVCEVNGTPQIGAGAGGDNHDRLLRRLFPRGMRIPVHLLLCGHADDPALPARLASLAGRLKLAATACRAEVMQDGELLAAKLPDGQTAARVALFDRHCRSLLFALTPREVLANGLPLDRIDAVQLPPQDDWPEDERRVLRAALAWCAAPVAADNP